MTKQNNGKQRKSPVAIKHARVLSNMVENGGKSGKINTISKAARKAGYSEAYIRSGKFQKTKAWGELINDVLPEDELLAVHQQGLNAVKKEQILVGRDKKGRPVYRMVEIEDYSVRHKYLDTAYKLKKQYTTDITVHNK